MDTSIISGWVPVALFCVTVAVCVAAVVVRKDVLIEFAIGIPVGLVLMAILFIVLAVTNSVPTGAPRSLYLWLGGACLLAGLVVVGWHRGDWTHRILGIVAIVLCLISAGSAVNQTFDYYPTVARLLGKEANHFLDSSALRAMQKEVDRTNRLPNHGATLAISIPDPQLHYQPRPAYVWLPPAWFLPSHPKIPVIELLHGTPGGPSDWTRASNADGTSLAFSKENKGLSPILVMPDVNGTFDGDTECVNSAQFGDVETYLTQVVPAYMVKTFGTRSGPGSMAIGGLSEGGTCAVTLSLNHASIITTFASYSGFTSPTYQNDDAQQTIGALFGGSQAAYDAHDPQYLLAHGRYAGLSGWFEAGQQDPPSLQAAHQLQTLAAQAGLDTCIASPPGGHDFAFWEQAFEDSLPWLSWKLKLTPEPTSIPAHCVSGSASRAH